MIITENVYKTVDHFQLRIFSIIFTGLNRTLKTGYSYTPYQVPIKSLISPFQFIFYITVFFTVQFRCNRPRDLAV